MALHSDLGAKLATSSQRYLDAYLEKQSLIDNNPADPAADDFEAYLASGILAVEIRELESWQTSAGASLGNVANLTNNYDSIMAEEKPTIVEFFTTAAWNTIVEIKFPTDTGGYAMQYDSGTDTIIILTL